jgi:hypothetical protein
VALRFFPAPSPERTGPPLRGAARPSATPGEAMRAPQDRPAPIIGGQAGLRRAFKARARCGSTSRLPTPPVAGWGGSSLRRARSRHGAPPRESAALGTLCPLRRSRSAGSASAIASAFTISLDDIWAAYLLRSDRLKRAGPPSRGIATALRALEAILEQRGRRWRADRDVARPGNLEGHDRETVMRDAETIDRKLVELAARKGRARRGDRTLAAGRGARRRPPRARLRVSRRIRRAAARVRRAHDEGASGRCARTAAARARAPEGGSAKLERGARDGAGREPGERRRRGSRRPRAARSERSRLWSPDMGTAPLPRIRRTPCSRPGEWCSSSRRRCSRS